MYKHPCAHALILRQARARRRAARAPVCSPRAPACFLLRAAACGASHGDNWPFVLALNLRSLYFCHLELSGDAVGRAGALRFADRMLRGMEKSVLAPPAGSAGGAGGGGSRKRKSAGVEGSAAGGGGRGGNGAGYHDKAAGMEAMLHWGLCRFPGKAFLGKQRQN